MVNNINEFALFEKCAKVTNQQGAIKVLFLETARQLTLLVQSVIQIQMWELSWNSSQVPITKNGIKLGSKTSTKASTKLGAKISAKNDSVSLANQCINTIAASSAFEPLYNHLGEYLINISDTCTGMLQDCYEIDMKYAYTNGQGI